MTLPNANPGRNGRALRVMVYDDDPAVGDMLEKMLREAGYEPRVMSHFGAALAMLDAEPDIDILLNDIVVPRGVNGLALARMARMRNRDIKVIYMTSYDLPGVEREALGPVLRKPITSEALLAAIQETLAEPNE